MDFSRALEVLKAGGQVWREHWGEGIFIYFVPGSVFEVNRSPLLGIYPEGTRITYEGHFDIALPDGRCAMWMPSVTELLANDWRCSNIDL